MKEDEFLKEYKVLCLKYNMYLGGCGCCGSPFLMGIKEGTDLYHGEYSDVKFEKFNERFPATRVE